MNMSICYNSSLGWEKEWSGNNILKSNNPYLGWLGKKRKFKLQKLWMKEGN